MFARICCALVMSIACLGGAHATDWQFRYQGFLDGENGTFLADAVVDGTFSGNDQDGNGIVSLDELTGFSVGGDEYINPNCSNPGAGRRCSLDAFSYRLTGTLAFDAT